MPQVSVVIPTYNRISFLRRAIESVLAQTYKDYEIVVVDDGSTDKTKDIVKKYGKKVRYIYQKNRGPSVARNIGIKKAKGKYIAFLDSDDRFLSNKLTMQIDYIKKHPNCKFLYTWYFNVNAKGKRKRLRKPKSCKKREQLQYLLYDKTFSIRTSTVLIQKECFKKAGYFNKKYWYSQDWDMWLRLSNYYTAHCLQRPLSEYRIHGDNRSGHKIERHHSDIKKSIKKLYGWDDKKIKKLRKMYGKK